MRAATIQTDTVYEVVRLDPRKIDPNPAQPRRFFFSPGDTDNGESEDEKTVIRRLAENILSKSQIQPILVVPTSKGRFMVVAGERRLRAAKFLSEELGEPWLIDAIIRNDIPPEKILDFAIAENAARQNLTAIEQIWAIQRLLAHGKTEAEIAAIFSRGRAWAEKYCLIAKLPTDVIRQMHPDNGRRALTISVAHEIAKRGLSETEVQAVASEVQHMPRQHAVSHLRVHHTPESTTPRRGRPALTMADQMIRFAEQANAQSRLFLRLPQDTLHELFSGRRGDARDLANELGLAAQSLGTLRNRIREVE
jgi:ParB/RepB/Spo0J family partition protein